MKKQLFVIKSANGLSSRASANLVSEANKYKSDIYLNYADEKANLKSIMNVMALVIRQDETFELVAHGEDEEEALSHLHSLMLDIKLV